MCGGGGGGGGEGVVVRENNNMISDHLPSHTELLLICTAGMTPLVPKNCTHHPRY